MRTIADILSVSPVIPVVTIDDAARAVPLARTLLRGGIGVIEITLRTTAAMDAIRAVAAEVSGMCVGAGTVLTARSLDEAAKAGAAFAISPGTPPALLAAAGDGAIPFLPGVATPTEIAAALDRGFAHLKFFPAEAFGGVAALRAFAGPFAEVRFCPTGGVTMDNARSYLALGNVSCIGGSWLTPPAAIAGGDWGTIERLARQAAGLRGEAR